MSWPTLEHRSDFASAKARSGGQRISIGRDDSGRVHRARARRVIGYYPSIMMERSLPYRTDFELAFLQLLDISIPVQRFLPVNTTVEFPFNGLIYTRDIHVTALLKDGTKYYFALACPRQRITDTRRSELRCPEERTSQTQKGFGERDFSCRCSSADGPLY
jgi:hypothetical protein